MLAEFNIYPMDRVNENKEVGRIAEILEQAAVPYHVGPVGILVEGTLAEVLDAVRRCHEAVAQGHERIITHLTLDDRKTAVHSLPERVAAVQSQLARRAFGTGIDIECCSAFGEAAS